MNLAQHILVSVLRLYRHLVSPLLTAAFGPMGLGCRFTPTCSEFAIEAVKVHGALGGSWLAICRLARCHPWGGQGFDPVPRVSGCDSELRVACAHEPGRRGSSHPKQAGDPPGAASESLLTADCGGTARAMPPFVSRSNGP